MSRMYLAAASSGKTTFLLEKTSDKSKRYLYTTFTDENAENARDMLIKKYGCVPSNVTILPWFSFLLEHGVRPFQGAAGFKDMQFTGIQIKPEGRNYYKQPALRHYCNSSNAIYAAKLPELALLCNKQSGGAVLNRLQRIFDAVLIDEVQDMAGYDYEFIELLINSDINIILCGDERQKTYRTNGSRKNKGKTLECFLQERKLIGRCPVDRNTLNGSHRCGETIIQFANKLYPTFPQTKSLAKSSSSRHSGVWLVPDSCAQAYSDKYHPVVLRDKSNIKTIDSSNILNFGKSKGRTYDDVLIYPVGSVRKWLSNHEQDLKEQTCSRFYVAVTRARYSVGIVLPDKEANQLNDIYQVWENTFE